MMTIKGMTAIAAGVVVLSSPGAGAVRQAATAADVLARAIAAHGGGRLTAWKTLVVEGTIDMQDGITYHAAYRLWARPPGRLRVEHDLTADRGRRFDEYFLNDGVAWSRRSLIPGRADVKLLQRWMDQCFGVAFYERHAAGFALAPDAVIEGMVPAAPGTPALKVADSRPARVLRGVVNGVPVELAIDRERFLLLQETTPEVRRVYWDFKVFDGVTWPTRVNEFTKGRQGETLTPITYRSIRYNAPIEDWLFEEDKPRPGAGKLHGLEAAPAGPAR